MSVISSDVVVVGAGPGGSTVARVLAENGLDVVVLEEHAEIGMPIHCTGIVGEELFRDFPVPRSLVTAELSRFRVHGPGGHTFDLPTNARSLAYALDRRALDVFLGTEAMRAGARYVFGAKARGVASARHGVQVFVGGAVDEVRARLCVLACGAMSNLPSRSGILPPRAFYKTVQASFAAEVDGAEIYLGSQLAAGSFGYAVGVGPGTAKVGIISRSVARNGYRNLAPLLTGRVGQAVSRESYRRIPMGACRQSVSGRVLAVGDAAGQTKTTTGGGIYYAMLCARMLCDTLLRARRGRDFHIPALAAYDTAWRRRIGLEIQAGLWLRGLFEHVADEEVDRLVALAASPSVQNVFEREWDFDFHHRLLLALARVPEMRRHAWSTLAATMRARRMLGFIFSSADRPT